MCFLSFMGRAATAVVLSSVTIGRVTPFTVPFRSPHQSTSSSSSSSCSRHEVGLRASISTDDDRGRRRDGIVERRAALRTAAAVAATAATTGVARAETDVVPPATTDVVPTVRLGSSSSSLEVSRTIQGYWQLAGGHGRYDPDEAVRNMRAHYDAGITALDTADIYGPSETIVGRFVASAAEQRQRQRQRPNLPPPVPCTKFCCFKFLDEIDETEVRTRVDKARDRLKVDKLPLVQFFWSNYDVKRYVDVALMLAELREEGLIGEIGATNFDLKRLKELKAAGVPLVSHQVQLSALDRRPVQSGMADWCRDNGVSLIAFGTVGGGILSERYLGRSTPPTQQEKNTASMRMYDKTASRFGDWSLVQELLRTMDAVAAAAREDGRCPEATLANVAQRYVLDGSSGAVASVLVGVRNTDHLTENVRTHSFALTEAELDALDAVVKKRSGPKGDVWDLERGYV